MRLSSFLTRLIWLCVLPLMVFSTWLVYDVVRQLQSASDQEANHLARNFATAIDYNLNARIGSLNVMAASPLADDPALWPLYYQVSQGYRANFGSHVIFAEAEEPMRMLFNTRAPLGTILPSLPKPKGNSAVQKALSTGQPAVGDIFVGPIAQERLVAIAVPLRRDDKVGKILVATVELRLFQDRLEQVSLPDGWGLSLRDGQGEVIARRPPAGIDTDVYRRVTFKTMSAPWSVILEIPRASYLAPMLKAGMGLGFALLAVALAGIGGGLWGTRRLSRAVASLAEPNHELTNGPDIAEIAAVRQRIDAASQRIASFATTQDQAIEEERRRVAREVHDQMGQVFTAIRMIVQSIPREEFPPGQEAALQQALDMGIASARKITAELRPPLLDDLGLAAALDYLGKELTRTTELACVVDLSDHKQLCGPQALTLFRIVQEAFTNILRHAGARCIEISGHATGGQYCLIIEDDGCGFESSIVRQGAMGLINMRERARLMNGECTITARPAGGTRVTISLPLDKTLSGNPDETAAG